MFIQKFNIKDHMALMCEWLLHRGAYAPSVKEMPKIGYVAYRRRIPVAMAFLRKVEGGFGQCDGLVSNPRALAEDRDICLDGVIDQVLMKARDIGLKGLISFSLDGNTLLRAEKHGFKPQQAYTFLSIDLNKQGKKEE